jgi:hypothetical protein
MKTLFNNCSIQMKQKLEPQHLLAVKNPEGEAKSTLNL